MRGIASLTRSASLSAMPGFDLYWRIAAYMAFLQALFQLRPEFLDPLPYDAVIYALH
jgi:hypothetical protein